MAGDDDLLDPSEIEALLAQANGGQPPAPPQRDSSEDSAAEESADSGSASSSSGEAGGLLDAGDIDALLREHGSKQSGPSAGGPAPSSGRSSSGSRTPHHTEELLSEAEASLAAALAPNLGGNSKGHDISGAVPLGLQELVNSLGAQERAELGMLQDVELDLRIELGRADLLIEEVVSLKAGSVVPLDKLAGDPVDILVNGRLIARGEVLVLNDNFCVRVAEILTPKE
ncbi:flagellar motor switch protein FliN [Rubinisphaera sp. JC750]|uniref:flagellar motor switch protein FliN n=1 Tax=Rubinisphaera sp. JC750 TaxID=2898658 RepID=UPI001EFFA830|nr:flagellar motor switch protein FliN [Rubinisphaera sp. JC750]